MTPEETKRFAVIEDAIGQLFQRLLLAEGRAFAAEQVLAGLAAAAAGDANARFAVKQMLEKGRVTALNSTEPEFKVKATEELSESIINLMNAMAKELGAQEKGT